MVLVLDAGALIAIELRDRAVGSVLELAQRDAVRVITSAAAAAQVWGDGARQANLARVLAGVDIRALDRSAARQVGALLRRSGTSDVVDAHVAVLAADGDWVLTSDAGDIEHLLDSHGTRATIVAL
jgi:hypothetical protein